MTVASRFKYTPYVKRPKWFTAVFGINALNDAHFVSLWNRSHDAFRREYIATHLRWERVFGKGFAKQHLPLVFRRAKRLGITADALLKLAVRQQSGTRFTDAKETP